MTSTKTWTPIIRHAALLAAGFTTAVTLRQLHYLLASSGFGGYENTQGDYKRLSSLTAEARRAGKFPALSDRTRGVARPLRFDSPQDAVESAKEWYRRDRTENQEFQTWLLYEKATLGAQIEAWTADYGIPTAALRGYSSESLEREIFTAMANDGRPVVAYYLGDLDPEGEDIERNFLAQSIRAVDDGTVIDIQHWERLAVLPAQIADLGLVPNPGKSGSSRAPGFIAKYGALFQIEVEAINPATLETLVTDAITNPAIFDEAEWDESRAAEEADLEALQLVIDGMTA